jgi:hypothetical protein
VPFSSDLEKARDLTLIREEIMLIHNKLTFAMTMAGALAIAGCGDNTDDPPICTGHAAANDPRCQDMKPIEYGGEILLEALVLPDGTEVTKVTTFVVDSVDRVDNRFGAYTNLPTPPPDDGSTVCTRYYPDNQDRWPLQDLNVDANEVTLDVGATITFSDGAGTEYIQARQANAMDTEGRTHDFVYTYVGDGLPPQGVTFTSTFETPVDAYTEVMKGGTYSPANIDWVSPAYNAAGLANGDQVTVDRSQAMTITWAGSDAGSVSKAGTDNFNLLAIYSVPAGPPEDFHYLCLTENDNEMTIPTDVLSNFPDKGLFIIGNIAHFQPKGTNGKVMHQIGRMCRVQLYTATN